VKNLDFQINVDDSSEDISIIEEGLDRYNNQFAESYVHKRLNVILKDKGVTVGGLLGGSYWGWFYIDRFWIREEYRKSGLGCKMLKMAEEEAISRGCLFAHLDTHDFQALDFYKKNGYEVICFLEDLPKGFNRYLMKKALVVEGCS